MREEFDLSYLNSASINDFVNLDFYLAEINYRDLSKGKFKVVCLQKQAYVHLIKISILCLIKHIICDTVLKWD